MRTLPLILLLAACQPGAPTEAQIDATRGATLFAQDCAACHGADATGGVGPDLTGLGRGDDFPTMRVMAQIDGLGRHGEPGAVMPEFGARGMGDTVIVEDEDGIGTPVPADLLALATYLRSIQR